MVKRLERAATGAQQGLSVCRDARRGLLRDLEEFDISQLSALGGIEALLRCTLGTTTDKQSDELDTLTKLEQHRRLAGCVGMLREAFRGILV